MSPLPHHSHGGYANMMHHGRDIVIPALFAPSFHNHAHPNMHQSMQQSISMQQHYVQQQQQQHHQPQMHMSPHVSSVPGSQTVRPIGSHMNMPVPNMNPSSSSAIERSTLSWEVRSKQRPTEENEYVAPLASESNHGGFPSKYGVSKDNADHQSSITSLDVVLSSERQQQQQHQQQQQQQYPSRVRPNMGNFSQRSLMSLSVDGMGASFRDFGGDPNYLSALFNSSLKITANNKPSTNRTNNMASSSHLAGTMEISVKSLDEEEDLSYFGDSAMMRMTDSQAEMSFGNVFEDNA
jgi:hypothetical protein